MDTQKIYSELKSTFPNLEIYQNHPLAPYTTVKIGGPADVFIHTKSSEELKNVLSFCRDATHGVSTTIPTTILGNGSNVLISDSGIRGIVIKNDSEEMEIIDQNKIKVSSGTQLSSLINYSLNHNLLGLEEFAYIPSTVGGAITGNIHGDNKTLFSQLIESIEKIDNFIISVILKLIPGDAILAKQKVKDIIEKKTTNQLTNSLGCTFKNPSPEICQKIWDEPKSAGWIIDNELNLKGQSIADAQISPLHANFIINNGHATAKDYLSLIELIQSQMQTKFNFKFELEIKLIG
jgi:UDP-N-acetylmuramate dehydrogenase